MTPLTPELALDLWYMAAQREFGIKFPIDPLDVEKATRAIYLARQDIRDKSLQALSLHVNDAGTVVYIYKNGVELE